MGREFSRTQRVADYLRRDLALLIQQEVSDPRVGMVTVTDAEVSRDFAHAKVFVTFVGDKTPEQVAESIDALNHAAGFLRTQVAKGTQWRTTPKLRFIHDESVYRGASLSALIDRAVEEDRRYHDGDARDDDTQDE
ncbi:MAG TPA: 30S ribosome-binding factor RbfA [Pseudomonadales bacterium]